MRSIVSLLMVVMSAILAPVSGALAGDKFDLVL